VDGDAFFRAFAAAARNASRRIMLLAWDIDSRIRIEGRGGPRARGLADFLHDLLARNESLHIHVLAWDFALIYSLEREPAISADDAWRRHPRLHFEYDGKHPVGACHHQKIIVIDDQVAFSGGLDLTSARWDTPEHGAHDPRRRNVGGDPYPPFHDVQCVVDGEAAASLGEIARERWWRATGEQLEPVTSTGDAWPRSCSPDLTGIEVAIARSDPGTTTGEVREVEQLFLDSIAAARERIFMETQYLTANCIADALAARLAEPDGPEVVIITQQACTGWLEEVTMGALRARVLRRLETADVQRRLGVFYPVVGGQESIPVNVHSKVMIIDDRLLRIGSANLSNRSMGLDSECDLALEARDEEEQAAIARFRSRLAGEHSGLAAEELDALMSARGSLLDALRYAPGSERRLLPVQCPSDSVLEALVPASAVVDPEHPLGVRELTTYLAPAPESERPTYTRHVLLSGILLTLLVGGLVWLSLGPMRESEVTERLLERAASLRGSPLAIPTVLAIYVVGTLCFVPLTVLNLQAALLFGFAHGALFALLGSLTGSFAAYALGWLLERFGLWPWRNARVQRLKSRLSRSGLLPVVFVRILPVAPNALVSLACGALRVRTRDFLLGSLIGLIPGVAAMAVVGDLLAATLADPGFWRAALVMVAIAVIVATGIAIGAWLQRREPATPSSRPRGEDS
jgi:phosphatidylserine/phosphatidylglycerophosphate/cardiolipin synthase-like enzyme/uncharacterized membrane protein YdjX (TVP38/TMEM64 family)